LRRMLDHFYLREKSEERLSIPYHHYEIILGSNEAVNGNPLGGSGPDGATADIPPVQSDSAAGNQAGLKQPFGHAALPAILGAVLLLMFGAIYYLQKTDVVAAKTINYPAIIFQGAEAAGNSPSGGKIEMVHSYLVGALEKFDQVRVFDEDAGRTNESQYLLESSILNDAADRIQLRLVDSGTREVVWSRRIEMTTPEKREAGLDKAVIEIAGPYGKIAQQELIKYRDDFTPGYPCLLQFHQYLRYRDPVLLKPVLQCMDASAGQFPNDSYLMSMLAVAKNVAQQMGLNDEFDGLGKDFALRAAKLDNDSASAAFAVAQSAFFESDCRKGVSWGKRAISLNPLNSRIMGYLGMYMLACGMPEGADYATRALQMDPDADLAVAATLAMQKLRQGDAKAALELSSKYMDTAPGAAPGLEITYILSSAMLGEKEQARNAWRELTERSGLPETADPRDVLSRWIANPDLLDRLETDFRKAGLYESG
jgi:hypothetical protein